MIEYEKMYAVLCGAVDTALELIEQNSDTRQVAETLQMALNKAESMYIEGQGAQHRSARQKRFSPHSRHRAAAKAVSAAASIRL